VYDSAGRIRKAGNDAVNSFAAEGHLEKLTEAVNELCRVPGINVKESRRRIADRLIEDNQYKF
jgi:hypothetical protein